MSAIDSVGRRDEKGHRRPDQPCRYAPLLSRPWRPLVTIGWILRWADYLFPKHLLYLSVLATVFVVPAHPIRVLFTMQLTALTLAQSHTGFEGPLFRGIWPAGNYFHYLHHKHVSCNFGFPAIPWDRWLGRFFDGEGPYRTRN